MENKRIVCYKYRGRWCGGGVNDFSHPIIDEPMCGPKYQVLSQILSGCKNRESTKTHRRSESDLTILDMFMLYPKDGRCPVLGIPLCLTNRTGLREDSPSLDKLIPSRGYMYGNVRIISWLANRIKRDHVDPVFFYEKAKRAYGIYTAIGDYIERALKKQEGICT